MSDRHPNTTDLETILYYSHFRGQRAVLMTGDNLKDCKN